MYAKLHELNKNRGTCYSQFFFHWDQIKTPTLTICKVKFKSIFKNSKIVVKLVADEIVGLLIAKNKLRR